MRNALGSDRRIVRPLRTALLLGILAALPVAAEHTRQWRQSTTDEFEKGTAHGVALRSDGRLLLAPRFADFADANLAYLLALRADSKGALYAAGGSNAKVLRFDAQGKSTTVFESPEMAAQALAIDPQDNLYLGTSPDGKVYKVTPAGQKSVFFEPKTKYIWALAFDADGTLYVATGDKGQIFAVKPDGKGDVFYASEESHIRSLAFDGRGNLLAGTEPNGLVLRISKSSGGATQKTSTFVVYETARKEITSLLVDRAGNTYVAAVGERTRVSTPVFQIPPQVQPGATPPQGQVTTGGAPPQQQPTPFVPFPSQVGSTVYRIAPDGSPQEIWSSRDELVYALALSPAGKLMLGTGNRGSVIQLEGDNLYSTLVKTTSSQITGLALGADGKVFLCGANPGKLFTLGPDQEPEGTFESQSFDARIFSQWGRLEWWGENSAPADSHIAFYVRSGNTSNPEKNWSPWAGPYTNRKGEKVSAPAARFVQWKAVLKGQPGSRGAAEGDDLPNISWVTLSYLPKNVAPSIEGIAVQRPGVRVQGFQGQPGGQSGPQSVQLRLPSDGSSPTRFGSPQSTAVAPGPSRFEPPPQGFAQKGYQAVLWSARDDNDDDLAYAVYYRGEGEKNWKLLKDKLSSKFYSWDATTMPDGAYYLKITVSDAPSNPLDQALSDDRESERFVVDNTPPTIENIRAESGGDASSARIRFDARDSASAISRAEYSLDAGDWMIAIPVGQLSDAPQESYDLPLKGLAPGEHTISVRVFDAFDNTVSGKVTFTVPIARR
jgi:outer membrane protein assembly factor BamB